MVTLSFPSAEAAAPAAEAPAPAPSLQAIGSGEAVILLVDDNEDVRATAAAYLRDGGLAVLEAPDAATALVLLEAGTIDAVVSDIVMPGEVDGMGLADAIRAGWPGLPVLLVSGFSERVVEAHARGFPVINKPYGLPELERRLRLLVEPQAVA